MRQLIIMYFIITLNDTTECGLNSIRQQRIAILCNKHKIPIAVDCFYFVRFCSVLDYIQKTVACSFRHWNGTNSSSCFWFSNMIFFFGIVEKLMCNVNLIVFKIHIF